MAASDWSERTRMIVTVSVVVAVNILLGGGLFMVRGEWKALEESRQQKVKAKKALEDEVSKEEKLASELKSLKDEIEATKRKLPDKENLPELVTKISDLAQSTHCTRKSFAYQPGGGGPSTAGLSVSQEVWKTRWEADFMNFCKLVNLIEEHFERFIAFENLMISPRNSGMVAMESKDAQEEISVDVVTYRYTGQ